MWKLNFQASKRQPGASGRLHRTLTGGWVWSEEEDETAEAAESDDDSSVGEDKRPMNQLTRADSSGSDNEEVCIMLSLFFKFLKLNSKLTLRSYLNLTNQ